MVVPVGLGRVRAAAPSWLIGSVTLVSAIADADENEEVPQHTWGLLFLAPLLGWDLNGCKVVVLAVLQHPRTGPRSDHMDESTIARFWSKVDKKGPRHPRLGTRCWEWAVAKDKDGYGVFGLSTSVKSVRAHRFSWLLRHHAEAEDLVLHACDNPSCVRPSHLFEGTPATNMADKMAKGRHVVATKGRPDLAFHGSKHGNAKLTEEQVMQIRAEYVPRKVPLRVFATRYGVCVAAVHYAIEVGWKHVGVPCL